MYWNRKTLWSLALWWIFEVFIWILLIVNLSLNQTLDQHSCFTNLMTQLILEISLWGVISFFNLKWVYAWSCSLCEGRTFFCTYLKNISQENSADFFEFYLVFDWLYFTQCFTSFSSIDHLFCFYAWFFI